MVPSSSLSKVSPGLPRSLQFAGGNGALAKKTFSPKNVVKTSGLTKQKPKNIPQVMVQNGDLPKK